MTPLKALPLSKRPKYLILGSNGYIGQALAEVMEEMGCDVSALSRQDFDVTGEVPVEFANHDAVFMCAGMSKFIECEEDRMAYRVNVDAPLAIARCSNKFVYLSSDVVERALHTSYGLQKALAEVGLLAIGNTVIARICKRVNRANIASVCKALVELASKPPGLYRV